MIQDSAALFQDFSKHFNSRLSLSDFIDAEPLFKEVIDQKVQPGLLHAILLPCDGQVFSQLRAFNYHHLLEKLMASMTIISEAEDIYCSKLDKGTFERFRNIFVDELRQAKVRINEEEGYFEIFCSKLAVELIWSPFSQFHAELTKQLDYFERIIEMKSLTASRQEALGSLFLNSKVPTPYSYFILAFLAENLGIPLKLS